MRRPAGNPWAALAARFSFLLLFLPLVAAGAWAADEPSAHILLYHRVGDARYPTTNVSLDGFRRQMQWLADEGFAVVSTRRIEEFLREGKPLPAKTAVLHFDDGLRSVYTHAFPVLKEFGYPFTVFLPTEAIDNRWPDYITWEMVGEMAKAGGEFSAHGHTHSRLSGPTKGEGAEGFRRRVQSEFTRSRDALAAHGLEARWAAYSFGEHGPDLLAAVREAGFTLGFTQDPGVVGRGADPFTLPRFAVVGTVADFDLFRERMGYRPLRLTALTPERGQMPDGAGRVGATLLEPGRYDPRNVNLFVSELGRLNARFDAVTGRIEAVLPTSLRRHFNRVIVTAREKDTGRFGMISWSLVRTP